MWPSPPATKSSWPCAWPWASGWPRPSPPQVGSGGAKGAGSAFFFALGEAFFVFFFVGGGWGILRLGEAFFLGGAGKR